MSRPDSYVRARLDPDLKKEASKALKAMGLTPSKAIQLLMLCVVEEQKLPFSVKVPNKKTKKAMEELEAGNAQSFATVHNLMADLNADD